VDVTRADGVTARAAYAWTISEAAAVLQSRAPNVFNLLALAGVLAALLWAAYPSARRLYARLDLNPATVTIALGGTAATVLFIAIGAVVIQNTQAQYEAVLNPPPAVINPTLPDAASLARGRALVESACAGWMGRDLQMLVERLPRTRDEELFFAVRDGWRGLPPCDAGLSDDQRWDVVNAVRALE
jgi:hypothetical protein